MSPPDAREIHKFIRLGLCTRWDATGIEGLRAEAGHASWNWRDFTWEARAQRVAPLLYLTLQDRHILPREVESAFREDYLFTAQRNLLLLHELAAVARHLGDNRIDCIALKGAALAQAVYHNPALRPMIDLDLLVRRDSVPRALDLLQNAGYMAHAREPQPGTGVTYENQLTLIKPGHMRTVLELHWGLLDSPYYQRSISAEWLWETACPLQIHDASALMLGPTAQLMHLCAHLCLHHRGDELLWLCDINELVHAYHDEVDWDEIVARSQSWELTLALSAILQRVAHEWAAPVPPRVLEALLRAPASSRQLKVFGWMTARRPPAAIRLWGDLASMSDWRAQLHFAYANLFPSRTYMRRRYTISHPLLVPLAYPYRWFIGLRDILRGPISSS